MKPSRVSMIVWNDFRNDSRVLKESETLQSAGFVVTVHAIHTPGVTQERETLKSGVEVIRVPRSPFWKWRKRNKSITTSRWISEAARPMGPVGRISFLLKLLRIAARLWTHMRLMVTMCRSRPDIIHAHDVNTLLTAWLVARLTRNPLVYDAHEISVDREGYTSFRSLVAGIEKNLLPHVTAVITTTNARAKFFARAYGIRRPMVLQNRPRFQEETTSNRIRDELKLTHNWPIVLYQGGLQQGRGLEQLINAAAGVDNAYFVFIGSGRLASTLQQQAVQADLASRVYFIPMVPLLDLPEYTESADIGIQPIENTCLNHFTTDSNKLFEYIMAGLPVIASNLPEIRKIVSGQHLGILVPPSDSIALMSAIKLLVVDQAKRVALGRNSKVSKRIFSWEQQEYKLLKLYTSLDSMAR